MCARKSSNGGGWPLEDRDAADVHVRGRALLEEEGRVQRAQRVEVLLGCHEGAGAYLGAVAVGRPAAVAGRWRWRKLACVHADAEHVQGRPRHRLLVRDRPRDGRAAGRAAAGPSTRPRGAPESIADLEDAGLPRCSQLDVTDEASMRGRRRARSRPSTAPSACSINNAGYSQSGAIETVGMDDVRRQFETNVFGLVRLTPARAARDARASAGARS